MDVNGLALLKVIIDHSTRLHSSLKSSAIHKLELTCLTTLSGKNAQLIYQEKIAQPSAPSLTEPR